MMRLRRRAAAAASAALSSTWGWAVVASSTFSRTPGDAASTSVWPALRTQRSSRTAPGEAVSSADTEAGWAGSVSGPPCMACVCKAGAPLSKMRQGFIDIRPLKIPVRVMAAKSSPEMWCQRCMRPT